MEKQVIRHFGKLALTLGLFALIATGCKLNRVEVPGAGRDWTTNATPPQICPGDPVLLEWDAGSIDSRSVIQITSDPDLFGGTSEHPEPRSETTVNPTEDTEFSFNVSGGGFANKRNSIDVLLPDETPFTKEVTFEGYCRDGATSRRSVDLGEVLGQCVEVVQVCNFSNPGSVGVAGSGGLHSVIGAGDCINGLNGKPVNYIAAMEPELSVGMRCGPTEASSLPRNIVLTFFLGCNGTLPGCMPPGSGGGMEPESLSSTPAAGACFDTCDATDANSCLAGLSCLPRSEGGSEYICYNESICSPSTPQEPNVTQGPSSDQPCVCGDGVCEQARCNELQQTCPADCGQPQQPPVQPAPLCGDNACNGNETCWTCSQDCGPC
jgi:hypothetical protein